MMKSVKRDLFVPTGRTARVPFCLGLALIAASVVLQSLAIRAMGNSLASFLLGLFWMCLNLYMIYTLFARRLHDISLSVGPLFAAIFITVLVIAFTVWAGGGGDYFDAMMANPQIAEDEAASRALIKQYQTDMADSLGWARWVNLVPLGLLSLMCSLKKGDPESNKYGATVHP